LALIAELLAGGARLPLLRSRGTDKELSAVVRGSFRDPPTVLLETAMFKSDLMLPRLLRHAVPLLAVLSWGCSGGEGADEPAQTPNIPLNMEPLTDAELMGVPREQVLLTLPWSAQVVSRDPAPLAARATLHSVEVAEGGGFDRATFEFGTDTDFPGYRIVWNDTANARCADEPAAELGVGGTLLIRLQPTTARSLEGARTVEQTSRSPDFPSVATARQLCDDGDRVVWALGAADSTVFRVVELHTPPRLVVDVAHPGAVPTPGLGAAPATAAPR
jgi:hypothetical protein